MRGSQRQQLRRQFLHRALAQRRLVGMYRNRPRALLEQLTGNPVTAPFNKRQGIALRAPSRQRHPEPPILRHTEDVASSPTVADEDGSTFVQAMADRLCLRREQVQLHRTSL